MMPVENSGGKLGMPSCVTLREFESFLGTAMRQHALKTIKFAIADPEPESVAIRVCLKNDD